MFSKKEQTVSVSAPVPETFKWKKGNCEFWLDLTENLPENTKKPKVCG